MTGFLHPSGRQEHRDSASKTGTQRVAVRAFRVPSLHLVRDQMLTIEAEPRLPKTGRYSGIGIRKSTVDRSLTNRIVHNRFWRENVWL